MVGLVQREAVDDHPAHRGDVGVVEHDALGAARRPAGVDDQGQGVGGVSAAVPGVAVRGGRGARDGGHVHGPDGAGTVADHHLRAGVLDLVAGLGIGEFGIDGCDRGAQPPGREHDDDEFQAIRQHDRHHITGADSLGTQNGCRRPDACEEFPVVQLLVVVRDTGARGIARGPYVRQIGDVLHVFLTIESHLTKRNDEKGRQGVRGPPWAAVPARAHRFVPASQHRVRGAAPAAGPGSAGGGEMPRHRCCQGTGCPVPSRA